MRVRGGGRGFESFTRFAAERNDEYGLGATPRAVYEKTLELIAELEAEPFPYPGTSIIITGDFFRELTIRPPVPDPRPRRSEHLAVRVLGVRTARPCGVGRRAAR